MAGLGVVGVGRGGVFLSPSPPLFLKGIINSIKIIINK
jgi:hypothetical protein